MDQLEFETIVPRIQAGDVKYKHQLMAAWYDWSLREAAKVHGHTPGSLEEGSFDYDRVADSVLYFWELFLLRKDPDINKWSKDKGSFTAFMLMALKRDVQDWIRTHRRDVLDHAESASWADEGDEEGYDEGYDSPIEQYAVEHETPESILMKKQNRAQRMKQIKNLLSPEQLAVFNVILEEGYKPRVIARKLGLTDKAVRDRVNAIRDKLEHVSED